MSLKKNMLANYIGQIYTMIIGIVMVPYYLQYLGAEAYGLIGIFALMQSWMSLLDMGMTPTLSREVARVKNSASSLIKEFKGLLHSLEIVFIVIALMIAGLIVFFSEWLTLHWLNIEELSVDEVSYSISLMGGMLGLRWLSGLYKSGIMGAEEQVWLNIANSIIATIKFVGVLLVFNYIGTDVGYFFEYQFFIGLLEFFVLSTKFYSIMKIGRFMIYFSMKAIRPILPFALGIAYTSGMWLLVSQFDKIMLSSVLPLNEYGYFALVGVISNAVLEVSYPIGKAILPRMTSLLNQGKEDEMLQIYKNSTQLMAILIFSIVGIICLYPYELLYSWTGDIKASQWASDILFWYVLANGISTMAAFQYYLQFAHGNLKIHMQYYTFSAVTAIPLIFWTAHSYGAIGVAITKFILVLVPFLIWLPIVHNRFAPSIQKDWILKDVVPILISTSLFLLLIDYFDLTFEYSRWLIFASLLVIGIVLLVINTFVSDYTRTFILKKLRKKL